MLLWEANIDKYYAKYKNWLNGAIVVIIFPTPISASQIVRAGNSKT